jgi:hypothetical protein
MRKKFRSGNSKGREHLEDIGVDGNTVMGWILEKWDER